MNHRIAIAGFRHAHIFDLYKRAQEHPRLTLAATCEEEVAASLLPAENIVPDFTSYETLLTETDCDIVAIGDAYGKRGPMAIQALKAGKHVLADKPICITLDQLETITALTSGTGLCAGMMLDMRNRGNYITMREVIRSGRIGEVQTVTTTGQHPLSHGKRPEWYFEKGMHGGTFNDIGIHAIDLIPWLTGLEIAEITSARSWNAKASFAPHFQDCAQCMLRLENGGGVLADFSYLAPDRCGTSLDPYWRISVHGTRGYVETCFSESSVLVADDSNEEPEIIQAADDQRGGYLEDFLDEVEGNPRKDGLDTRTCLKAARTTLGLELFVTSR